VFFLLTEPFPFGYTIWSQGKTLKAAGTLPVSVPADKKKESDGSPEVN
jgi:hypothetical protein